METELHKCLINYFSQLKKVDCKWKELSEEAERPLHGLRNQSEQLRLVTRVETRQIILKHTSVCIKESTLIYHQVSLCYSKEVKDVDLCKIDELYERLIYKILMGIDNEVTLLLDISSRFNNVTQDLKNRLKNLEEARSKVSLNDVTMKKLVNGTPDRPKLDLLLEWAIDAFNYYHELYLQFNGNLKQFDYKREETIENVTKSFVEDRFKRARIDRIFTFTQFLIMETVR